jgi:hypothetical protein
VSNEGGSGDELYFDDHMVQQELGTRSRHRQSLVNLYYNINHELQQERESGGQDRLRGRNERCRRLEGGMLGQQRSMEVESLSRGREEGNMDSSPISKQTLKRNGNWTSATLQQAMDAIIDHRMKVRIASRSFGIPATTLRNHLYGRSLSRQKGQQLVLKEDEEKKTNAISLQDARSGTISNSWSTKIKSGISYSNKRYPLVCYRCSWEVLVKTF